MSIRRELHTLLYIILLLSLVLPVVTIDRAVAQPTEPLSGYTYGLAINLTAIAPQNKTVGESFYMLPDGAGAATGIASSSGCAGGHYLCVDDPVDSPDDAATFVYTTAGAGAPETDYYTLSAPWGNVTEVVSVTVYFRVKWGIGTNAYSRPILYLGGDVTLGDAQTNPAAYTTYNQTLARPGGGDWQVADLADLQVGIRLWADAGKVSSCTQVYVKVSVITSGSAPAIPSNPKISLDVYADEPTVEVGTWTVNSRSCTERIAFTVQTTTAPANNTIIEVAVDVSALVAGGFLGSSAGNASTVEWDDGSPSSGFDYWAPSNDDTDGTDGTPLNWNTNLFKYLVELPNGLSSNTFYTYYLYIPASTTSVSSNWDAGGVFSYYEGFGAESGGLYGNEAAMQADYPDWTWLATPLVSSSGGHIRVDSDAAATGEGIVNDSYTASDFVMYCHLDSAPGSFTYVELQNVADGANYFDRLVYNTTTGEEFAYNDGGGAHAIDCNYLTAPFTMRVWHVDGKGICWWANDADNTEPDTYARATSDIMRNYTVAESAYQMRIFSYNTAQIDIDWIGFAPHVYGPPLVDFPDITYERAGAIFLNGNCANWDGHTPGDLAFSDASLNQFYWTDDPLTQLTRQPSVKAIQVTIRVPLDLSTNQTIYAWYGNAAQATPDSYYDASQVWGDAGNLWDDFNDETGWTEPSGTWAIGNVSESPVIGGDVGNIGGGAGRSWIREFDVFGNATSGYWAVMQNPRWEYAGSYWPVPYQAVIAEMPDGIGGMSNPGERALDFDFSVYRIGNPRFTDVERVGTTTYIPFMTDDGVEIAYTTSDPMDETAWSLNPNGPFIPYTWWNAQAGTAMTAYRGITITYYNGVYYLATRGCDSDDGQYLASTAIAPENWSGDGDITYRGQIYADPGYWTEDTDLVFDGTSWWFYATKGDNSVIPAWKYTNALPYGGGGGPWYVYQGTVTFTNPPPYANIIGGPHLVYDGTDWWMWIYGQSTDDVAAPSYTNRWVPNWIIVAKSPGGTLDLSYTCQNVESKYKQTNAGVAAYRAYYSSLGGADDIEITAEVQITGTETYRMGGVVFAYDGAADSGYWARVDYNSGTPTVALYRVDAGSSTVLETTTLPNFPTPQYCVGFPMRIRVQKYGAHIVVYYSLWGDDWVQAADQYDGTYASGYVGFRTYSAKVNFDQLRVSEYMEDWVVVGQGGEFSYLHASGGIGIGPQGLIF